MSKSLRALIASPYSIVAGKFEDTGADIDDKYHGKNVKYVNSFETAEEAIEIYNQVKSYPWVEIELCGRLIPYGDLVMLQWWEAHRPVGWTISQHADSPNVNVSTIHEDRLALHCADLVNIAIAQADDAEGTDLY